MPEQKSQRGQLVTVSPFEQPFETAIYPYGQGGVNLKDQLDAIPVGEFAAHTNLIHTMDRGVTVRPGLTTYATAGANHHTVRRLNDPQNATFTRIWGIDQSLYLGQSGALASIDTGYSGQPLTLLPHRPPLSGDPWMFVGDSLRMRKVRVDGLDLPIGLPAPAAAPSTVLGTRNLKTIGDWTTGSDTDPALWTRNTGFTYDDPPAATDLPEILHLSDCPDADLPDAIHFGRIASSVRVNGDYVYFGLPLTRDLSTFDGVLPITDDDYVHLWLNFSHPLLIEEFRIYIVVAPAFSPTVLPGVPDAPGVNTDAYVKSFSRDDFAAFFAAQADGVSSAEAARVHAVRDAALTTGSVDGGYRAPLPGRLAYIRRVPPTSGGVHASLAQADPARAIVVQAAQGADQYHEMGVLGVPVRRGDFQRMGETPNRDWSTVTGIVTMIKTGANSGPGPVAVRLGNFYVTGGKSPDSGEPGAQPYDFRSTDYDPRTGAESNPGPEQSTANQLDTLRRAILVTPPPATDGNLRQRIYARGGSLINDWFFAGINTSNGGVFTYEISDEEAQAAGTMTTDRYQPVPTVDDTGATVLAQPVPVIFGPASGMIFGLGDPYRPGHLYWSHPDEPDHWGANNWVEVCPPSEELMAGFLYGAQPFVFSRARLYAIYPNLSGGTAVAASTTACRRGIVSRTAWAIGRGGIYGVSTDGVFVTSGGQEVVISNNILRLFRGESWNTYNPIDFNFPRAIRLSIWNDILYLQYQDTGGARQVLVLSLLYETPFWTPYHFAPDVNYLLPDDEGPTALLLVGGLATGKSYTHSGFSDDGVAIPWLIRTCDWNLGRPREDKLLGDQILDADLQGVSITLTNRLNDETVTNSPQGADISVGRKRFIFDSFGTVPQRARNINTEISGSSATARPILYFLGQSFIPEPDVTINRVTQWDDLNHPDESYVTGITLDVDTGGIDRTIIFERDFAGLTQTIATKTVNTNGRHKLKFSWDAVPAHKVRIRPNDDCKAWILYKADWIALPEPPRIAGWDIHFEADGDQYFTGLDLYCDTGGAEKQIEVSVDGNILVNPYTLEAFWRITADGRRWRHLTFLADRGHVFHFRALDLNPGLLYTHKWYTDSEPSEQANWNQNFSSWGTQADKYLKAIIFECDTFGIAKQVRVEVDGTLAEILTVQTNGRLVQQIALTSEKLGRIWRIYPSDGNPGRLYTAVPVFDVEPYQLDRWETQETDHDLAHFQAVLELHVTLKSTTPVTLTLSTHVNQIGTVLTDTYTIPSTKGIKQKCFVPCVARKGVLFKYLFTAPAAFFLYQEESHVVIQPWGAPDLVRRQPFGNSDNDRTRRMVTSVMAAATSGGGT